MNDSILEAKKALIDVIIDTIEIPDDMVAAPTLATTNINQENDVNIPNNDKNNDSSLQWNSKSQTKLMRDESSDKISLFVTDLSTFEQTKISQENSINKETVHELVALLMCANLHLNVACM